MCSRSQPEACCLLYAFKFAMTRLSLYFCRSEPKNLRYRALYSKLISERVVSSHSSEGKIFCLFVCLHFLYVCITLLFLFLLLFFIKNPHQTND